MVSSQKRPSEALCTLAMLLVAFLLGSSFIGSKVCLNAGLNTFETIFYRASICTAAFAAAFFRQIRTITRQELRSGLILGTVACIVYAVETTGIRLSEPTKASLLISTNIVIAPFLTALVFHQRIRKQTILAALVTMLGTASLTVTGSTEMRFTAADILLLIAAVCYAVDANFAAKFCADGRVGCITFLQFAMVAVFSGILALFEGFSGSIPLSAAAALLYLGLFPMFLGFCLRNSIIRYVGPVKCTLLQATNGIFCAVLSYLFFQERFTPQKFLGMILIFTGIAIEVLTSGHPQDAA